MNILLVNHYAGNPSLGMEYRPFYFAREWRKQGHIVYIVTASYAHLRSTQIDVQQNFTIKKLDGVCYIILKTPPYRGNTKERIINILSFIRRLYQYKKWLPPDFKPDVIIASSTYPLEIIPLRKMADRVNAKLIFEVHDLWPLSPIELGGFSRFHPFIMVMQYAENYAYKYSMATVSLLPKAYDHMKEHGLEADRFYHIPNGISIEDWQIRSRLPDTHDALIKNLKEKQNFLVCYAGSIGIANALDCFTRAAKQISHENIYFIIVGEGPQKNQLLEIAKQEKIANFTILPPIPKILIPLLLSKMDVLYVSFQRQSLFRFGISPNKIMDYMMAGKPIIQAIDAGNDMISEAKCGITVEPENINAIADAVIQLFKMNNESRQILGKNGKEYVIKNHDYKILAEKFLEIIRN